MDEVIYQKLSIIWEAIKPYCLGMYIGGSSSIPCIKHPHDIDVVYIYDSKDNGREILKLLRFNDDIHALKTELRDEYNIIIFGDSLDRFEKIQYWSYQDIQFLFGSCENYKKFSVLEYQTEYLDIIKKNIELAKKTYNNEAVIHKALYRSLIIYYYILNNSYELTEEQVNNINLAHDAAHDKQYIAPALQLLNQLDEAITKLQLNS